MRSAERGASRWTGPMAEETREMGESVTVVTLAFRVCGACAALAAMSHAVPLTLTGARSVKAGADEPLLSSTRKERCAGNDASSCCPDWTSVTVGSSAAEPLPPASSAATVRLGLASG